MSARAVVFWLVLTLALGAALRLYRIDAQSLWDDEISTYHVATYPLSRMWDEIARLDSSPMMYYTLLRPWILHVPRTEAWMRAFSALLGLAAVLALFLVAERLAGRRAALFAAFLAAVNPFQIYASQEVRYNALVLLSVLLSLYFFIRLLERGRWRHWLGYVIATGTAAYTHYFAFFVPAAQLAVVALMAVGQARAFREDRDGLTRLSLTAMTTRSGLVQSLALTSLAAYAAAHRGALRRAGMWLSGLAVVGVLFVPFLKVFAYQLLRGVQFREPEPLSEALSAIWIYTFIGHSPIRVPAISGLLEPLRDSVWFYPALFGVVLPVVLLVVAGFFDWRDRDRRRIALAYLLVPLALAVLMVLKVEAFDPRYYLPYMPAALIFAGKGLDNLLRRSRVLAVVLALYAVCATGASLRDYYLDPAYHRQDFRGTVRSLVDRAREGDAILFYYHMGALPFLYYFDYQVPYYYLYTFREAFEQSLPDRRFRLARNMERFLGRYTRLWLVDYHGFVIDPLDDTRMLLKRAGYERIERWCRYPGLYEWCIDLYTSDHDDVLRRFAPVVDFADPDHLDAQLGEGWFPGRNEPRRWIGREATATVTEPEGGGQAFATFFANYGFLGGEPFGVTLAVDGVEVGRVAVNADGFFTVSGPLPDRRGAGSMRVLTLSSDRVFVPAEVMGGSDLSEKSVTVSRIGIGAP